MLAISIYILSQQMCIKAHLQSNIILLGYVLTNELMFYIIHVIRLSEGDSGFTIEAPFWGAFHLRQPLFAYSPNS